MSTRSLTTFTQALVPQFNAVLIKELRQELRAKAFVNSFIWFHVLMLIFTLFSYAPDDSFSGGSEQEAIFWGILCVPLLLILPLRAGSSFSKEAKAQELELIFLTRITAWKLVFNKWLAVNLQGLLLLIAALPYTIVRHFLGGMNWIEGIGILIVGLLGMLSLSAMALLGSSWMAQRGQMPILVVIFGFVFGVPAIISGFTIMQQVIAGGYSMSAASPLFFLAFFALAIWLILEFAASNIAAAAENHALRQRIIGLLAIAVAIPLVALGEDPEIVVPAAAVFIATIVVHGLCQVPVYIQSIYAPFSRKSALGKLIGAMLYPGWPSAIVYLVVVSFPTIMILEGFAFFPRYNLIANCLTVIGSLLMPVVIFNLFTSFRWNRFFFYGIFQAAHLLLATIGLSIGDYSDKQACIKAITVGGSHTLGTLALSLLPASGAIKLMNPGHTCVEPTAQSLSMLLIILLALFQLTREWKKISVISKLSAKQLEKESVTEETNFPAVGTG